MSLLAATWISAIATAVLAVGAGFTVHYARKAFLGQSDELSLLQKQVSAQQEDTERQTRQLERRQADAVGLIWWAAAAVTILRIPPLRPDGWSLVVVENKSPRPIRDISCRVHPGDGRRLEPESTGPFWAEHEDPPGPLFQALAATSAPVVRPGSDIGFLVSFALQTDTTMAIRFTDDAGLHWQIDQELHLQRLEERDW